MRNLAPDSVDLTMNLSLELICAPSIGCVASCIAHR
jgi:hypothetical protein